MILIALGANLPSRIGTPRETCNAALAQLALKGARPKKISRWYSSAPVPQSDQPNYINGVALIETVLTPFDLLEVMLDVEEHLGRLRTVANAARMIDLDLLAYDSCVRETAPVLPHPRLHERAFVLLPLRDVAPAWRHPVTGQGVDQLISALKDPDSAVPASD